MHLRFASCVVVNLRWDFHPQDRARAGRTSVQIVASHDLTVVVGRRRHARPAALPAEPELARFEIFLKQFHTDPSPAQTFSNGARSVRAGEWVYNEVTFIGE